MRVETLIHFRTFIDESYIAYDRLEEEVTSAKVCIYVCNEFSYCRWDLFCFFRIFLSLYHWSSSSIVCGSSRTRVSGRYNTNSITNRHMTPNMAPGAHAARRYWRYNKDIFQKKNSIYIMTSLLVIINQWCPLQKVYGGK